MPLTLLQPKHVRTESPFDFAGSGLTLDVLGSVALEINPRLQNEVVPGHKNILFEGEMCATAPVELATNHTCRFAIRRASSGEWVLLSIYDTAISWL